MGNCLKRSSDDKPEHVVVWVERGWNARKTAFRRRINEERREEEVDTGNLYPDLSRFLDSKTADIEIIKMGNLYPDLSEFGPTF